MPWGSGFYVSFFTVFPDSVIGGSNEDYLIILLKVNCTPVKRQIAVIYLLHAFTQEEVEFPSLFILFPGVLSSDHSISYFPLHPLLCSKESGLTFLLRVADSFWMGSASDRHSRETGR